MRHALTNIPARMLTLPAQATAQVAVAQAGIALSIARLVRPAAPAVVNIFASPFAAEGRIKTSGDVIAISASQIRGGPIDTFSDRFRR